MEFLIASVEILDTSRKDWFDAGFSLQSLRKKDITLPITDALIAAIASRHSIPVLTIDKHFVHLPVVTINPLD